MENKRPLTAKEKKQLEKKRKQAAKQAKQYHKAQDKKSAKTKSSDNNISNKAKKTKTESKARATSEISKRRTIHISESPEFQKTQQNSSKTSNSKIVNAVNAQQQERYSSREEKFRRESDKIIQNLEPTDSEDGGYYVDEFTARQKQERRAQEIRSQESEVIRRHKKHLTPQQIKRRRIIMCSSIFAVVLIVGVILSLTVLFKTEKIDIEGDQYYYDEQIVAFSSVELQQNIFIAAMNATPQEIIDNLPYIEDVKIGFSVPDTVTIKITDAVPSYVISNNGSYLVVSSKGRILERVAENSSNLPELSCDELKTTEVGEYVSFSDNNIPDILEDVSESLSANEVTNITGFDVTDTANITLNYDNRILINLGLPEDIDYKIKTAMAIINEKLDPNNTGAITGTLDVSTCNTTKMSHYKPLETTQPATTVPQTTAAADNDSSTTDDNNYTWSADSYDDSGYSYDDGSYSDDTNGYQSYDDSADYGYSDDNNVIE